MNIEGHYASTVPSIGGSFGLFLGSQGRAAEKLTTKEAAAMVRRHYQDVCDEIRISRKAAWPPPSFRGLVNLAMPYICRASRIALSPLEVGH